MAYTTIDDPSKYFQATVYTGNGSASARNIDTGVASDWVWIKNRGAGSTDNMLYDSSRGVGKYLRSNKSDAEDTSGTSLSAFNSNYKSLFSTNYQYRPAIATLIKYYLF